MPRSTIRHPHEYQIFQWAGAFKGIVTWFVVFDADGRAGEVLETKDRDLLDRLKAGSASWFFYDPFDYPEYGWVQWQACPAGVMERFFGKSFPEGLAAQVPPTGSFMY